MRILLEQVLSFIISGALGGLGVVIRYSNKIRNDEPIKLRWFLSEMATGFLLAGASYTIVPEGGLKVPMAVFIGYFSHTLLDLLEKRVPGVLESRFDKYVGKKAQEIESKKTKKK